MLIAELIKNHAQQKKGNVEYHLLSRADGVQCPKCLRFQMLQGITEEVKEEAELRISSPYIVYVPGIHDLAVKNTQRGLTL